MCWDLEANKVSRFAFHFKNGKHLLGHSKLSRTSLWRLHDETASDVGFHHDWRTRFRLSCVGYANKAPNLLHVRTRQYRLFDSHAIHRSSSIESRILFPIETVKQVITGSHDATIKLWDLRKNKTMTTLTHHKKSVRAMALHAQQPAFCSASAHSIKKFKLPEVD